MGEEKTVKEKPKKNFRWILYLVYILLGAAFIVCGMILARELEGIKNPEPSPQPSVTQTAPQPKPSETPSGTAMQNLYPDAPAVRSGEVQISIQNNSISTSYGTQISFNDAVKILDPKNKCTVSQPTDFCIVTEIESQKKLQQVFFFKDAVHAKIFENPEHFEQLDFPNAKAALTTVMIGDKQVPAIVIVHKDSSGWVITQEDGTPIAKELLKMITLKEI